MRNLDFEYTVVASLADPGCWDAYGKTIDPRYSPMMICRALSGYVQNMARLNF